MRRRFWVGLITCLFATFSISPLMAISKQKCDGPVCGSTRVSGGSRLRARATVRSPSNCWGGWGITVRAGNLGKNPSDYYTKGTRKSAEVEAYTSNAAASVWITGYNKYGNSYDVYVSERSGG